MVPGWGSNGSARQALALCWPSFWWGRSRRAQALGPVQGASWALASSAARGGLPADVLTRAGRPGPSGRGRTSDGGSLPFPLAMSRHSLGLRALNAGAAGSQVPPSRVGLKVPGLGSQTPARCQAPLSSRDLSWEPGAWALRRCQPSAVELGTAYSPARDAVRTRVRAEHLRTAGRWASSQSTYLHPGGGTGCGRCLEAGDVAPCREGKQKTQSSRPGLLEVTQPAAG